MNRDGLAAAILMASSTAVAAAQSGWVTVGEHAYSQLKQNGYRVTIRANRPAPPAAPDGAEHVYLLEVALRDVPDIARTLHRKLRHCGGLMFHSNETDARNALGIDAQSVPARATRPGYAIANQDKVKPLLENMDEHRVAQTITQLAGFVNRYYSSAHGAEASNWLRDHWSGISLQHAGIAVSQFVHAGYGQRSVIATIAGSDKAAPVIVLGGHLDSINLDSTSAGAPAPGADDDASGIAGLTEVLRVLAASNYQPRRTIKLIAYAAEEVGLRGSQEIARVFVKNKVDVAGVLQLDMSNYKGSDKDIYLISDYTDSEQNQFLERLVGAYLPALTVGRDKCGYACSDHAAWNALGFATSMPFEAAMRQDNPHIHTRGDTFANSGGQAAHALKFARLAAAFAVELGSDAP